MAQSNIGVKAAGHGRESYRPFCAAPRSTPLPALLRTLTLVNPVNLKSIFFYIKNKWVAYREYVDSGVYGFTKPGEPTHHCFWRRGLCAGVRGACCLVA